jgi:hypothetical protein
MVSAEHNAKRDDDKNKKKKKRTKSAPTQYTYIAKIAKKYLGVDKRDSKGKVVEKNPNRLTFSKAGIAEVSILMDSAVKQILQNSDQVRTVDSNPARPHTTAHNRTRRTAVRRDRERARNSHR